MSLRHTPLQFADGIARILSITRVNSRNRAARRNAKKRTPIGRLLSQRRQTRDCRYAAKRRNAVLTSHTFRSPQTDVARTTSCQFTKPSGSPQRQKRTPIGRPFLAQKTRFELVLRFSHTTPLAGEPLEPLGYFCNSSITFFLFKSYITIPHFFGVVKAFYAKNTKKFLFLFFPFFDMRHKSFLRKYSQILDGFFTIVYNKAVENIKITERIHYESNYH